MVLKKTSKEGIVFPRSENPKGAFQADFDMDGAALKRLHKEWLDDYVVKPAKSKARSSGGWEIELTGRASKSGSDAHNLWLSDQRMKSVAGYLYAQLSSVPFILVPRAIGESSPYDGDEYEHELDRSVEVIATFRSVRPRRITKPTLLIPKVHPWRRPVNRKVQDFKLQVLKAEVAVTTLDLSSGLGSFGRGDARVKLFIQIDEVGTPDYAQFEYQGFGPGTIATGTVSLKRVKVGPGLSQFSAVYDAGKVHPFATDVEMDAEDFGGPALFQFNLLGRTFRFGPKTGLFGPDTRIRNLSFGMTRDEELLQEAEGQTFGDMNLVTSIPEWAK